MFTKLYILDSDSKLSQPNKQNMWKNRMDAERKASDLWIDLAVGHLGALVIRRRDRIEHSVVKASHLL